MRVCQGSINGKSVVSLLLHLQLVRHYQKLITTEAIARPRRQGNFWEHHRKIEKAHALLFIMKQIIGWQTAQQIV